MAKENRSNESGNEKYSESSFSDVCEQKVEAYENCIWGAILELKAAAKKSNESYQHSLEEIRTRMEEQLQEMTEANQLFFSGLKEDIRRICVKIEDSRKNNIFQEDVDRVIKILNKCMTSPMRNP